MDLLLLAPRLLRILAPLTLLALWGCSEATDAPQVELPVFVQESPLTFTTNLGYDIQLGSISLALADLRFTVAGEEHVASVGERIKSLFIPQAIAHPGHYQGGEVTGEILGSWKINWPRDVNQLLGDATLLAGNYKAANFRFERSDLENIQDTVLHENTLIVVGTATRDGEEHHFRIVVDAPADRWVDGVVFEATVTGNTSGSIGLSFRPADPLGNTSFLDGVDFAELAPGTGGAIPLFDGFEPNKTAFSRVRRALLSHDYYVFELH